MNYQEKVNILELPGEGKYFEVPRRRLNIFFSIAVLHLVNNWELKGHSNEIFSYFEPTWATDQWVKIFSILVIEFAELFECYHLPGV